MSQKISLQDLTLQSYHQGLVSKDFRASEVVQEYYKNIRENDSRIGAYLSLLEEEAMRRADEIDKDIQEGKEVGLVAGVPLGVKDNMLIKDSVTTAGSKILKNYVAAYDSGAIQNLKAEKAIFLGKTNLDEFAMGSSTENSAFHVTKHPHDPERVAGGSSGGSSAAVAADMAMAALGSDTFGSIRQPSSFCGVVGLKPTYGAVSRSGLIAMSSSMDQIGPITKNVADSALLFKAISGYDPLDATSASVEYGDELMNPDFSAIKKLRIGIPEEYFIDDLSDEVRRNVEKAINDLKSLGIEVKSVSLPHTKYAVPCYYVACPAEVSSNLARFDGTRYSENADATRNPLAQRGKGFGSETMRRVILGTFVLSSGYHEAYYKKAQQVRRLIAEDFTNAFQEVDVLLTPVAPTTAFKIGEKADDPVSMYLSDIFTGPVNLAGLPAISIPIRNRDSKLPIGFQLIGKHFREADILGMGRLYEES